MTLLVIDLQTIIKKQKESKEVSEAPSSAKLIKSSSAKLLDIFDFHNNPPLSSCKKISLN
jgi:hypothetical protein